jgi:transcription initiation factor TFIID TATA-box-binding protein
MVAHCESVVEIQNIVGSGDLGVEVDLVSVLSDIDIAITRYDPENYHGGYLRFREDHPLITLYRSGKYILTGAKSIEELHRTQERFLEKLVALGIVETSDDPSFTVQNVVCTGDLGHAVDLTAVAVALGFEVTEYEPEQFPGLIYRSKDSRCVLLVFSSGKVVITAATDGDAAEQEFDRLQNRLAELLSTN